MLQMREAIEKFKQEGGVSLEDFASWTQDHASHLYPIDECENVVKPIFKHDILAEFSESEIRQTLDK